MAIKYWNSIVSLKEYKKLHRQKLKPKEKPTSLVWRKCWWLDKDSPFDSYDWTILSEPKDWKIRVNYLNRRTGDLWINTINFKQIRIIK